jgi:hypothetical protein
MMSTLRICLIGVLALSITAVFGAGEIFNASAQSDDLPLGTYGGSFTITRGEKPFEAGMELVITSAEQGRVKGSAKLLAGQCAGAYAMEGVFESNNLRMKGSGGPCPFGFNVARAGNELVGSTGAGFALRLVLGATSVAPAPSEPPDESLLGSYTGNFLAWEPLNIYAGMTLVLTSIDAKGVVQGTATVYLTSCAGIYSMQGRYVNGELGLRGTGGPCAFGFRAKRDGTTLVGMIGDHRRLTLSKVSGPSR